MMPDRPLLASRRLLLLGGGTLLAATLTGCGGAAPVAIQPRALPAFPGNSDRPLLIDPASLAHRRTSLGEALLILDASDRADYRTGHIPGAIHTHWQETIERDAGSYGTVLAPADDQARRLDWMRRHGIDPARQVVICERGDGRRAARLVWFLHFLGHPAVAMLDGGVAAWRGAGFALASGIENPPSPRRPPVVDPRAGFVEGARQALARRDDPTRLVLDIRTAAERAATPAQGSPIAPSCSLPWTTLLDPTTGQFVPPDATSDLLQELGLDVASDILLVGRYGVDANPVWLALRLRNVVRIASFDPGWSSWTHADNLVG